MPTRRTFLYSGRAHRLNQSFAGKMPAGGQTIDNVTYGETVTLQGGRTATPQEAEAEPKAKSAKK